jgi:transcription elongation factor Elf1
LREPKPSDYHYKCPHCGNVQFGMTYRKRGYVGGWSQECSRCGKSLTAQDRVKKSD